MGRKALPCLFIFLVFTQPYENNIIVFMTHFIASIQVGISYRCDTTFVGSGSVRLDPDPT